MKAAVYTRYGPPDVLHIKEVEQPTPGDKEVLVKIYASTLNSGDMRMRKADPFLIRLFAGLFRPRKNILGFSLSGIVAGTGKQVQEFKTGDPVFGSTGFKFGAWAQYVAVPEKLLIKKPPGISHETAAALPFGGNTALWYLKKGGVREGQQILIYGASGSTGSMAIQLSRHFGAHVTAVCSTDNVEMVRALGAGRVIDYKKEDIASLPERFDVVFDAVGKLPVKRAKGLLVPGGKFVSVSQGISKSGKDELELLGRLADTGVIKPAVDKTWPLDQIVEANRYGDKGRKKGNIVITIPHQD